MQSENGFAVHLPSLVPSGLEPTLEENMSAKNLIRVSMFLVFMTWGLPILAQTTSVTYQGKLTDGGNPANGQYDFVFRLFDSSGTQIGGDLEKGDVQVTGGIFTVSLNFGLAPFTASTADTVEIGVRPGASTGTYTTLTPRQPLTSEPYSIKSMQAAAADTATNSLQLGGVAASQFVLTTDPRMTDSRSPISGSPNYVQNTTTQQGSTNFNISGNGIVGGTFSGGVVNTPNHFSIAGIPILNAPGIGNTIAGFNAGFTQPFPGDSDSFFGSRAGMFDTGNRNSFFGSSAGESNFGDGSDNSFFGNVAGSFITHGSGNSYFGSGTGNTNRNGSNNTVFGAFADLAADNLTNATAIGFRSSVSQNNSLVLGSINGINGATADTNVGIGTTLPATKLHVSGTGIIRARINSDSNAGLALTLSDQPGWSVATANGGHFQIFNDAVGSNAVWIDKTNNNVGIGSTSPGQKLDVLGNVQIGTGTTGCITDRDGTLIAGTCSSDMRFKKNIAPFGSVLRHFSSLRPVYFDWRSDEFKERNFGSHRAYGLIAQEVEKLFPELVLTDQSGYKAVNYSELPLLTIQAVKEQQTQIEAQQKLIASQQDQIDALRALICSRNRKATACLNRK